VVIVWFFAQNRTDVEGILRVGVSEEEHEGEDHGLDREDGLPVLVEHVDARLALHIDVGVPQLWTQRTACDRRNATQSKDGATT